MRKNSHHLSTFNCYQCERWRVAFFFKVMLFTISSRKLSAVCLYSIITPFQSLEKVLLHSFIPSLTQRKIQFNFSHMSCLKYILFLLISDVVIYVLGYQQSQLFVYVVAGYEEAFKSTKTFRLFKHSTTQEFFLVLLLLVISSFVDFVPCGVDFFVTVTRL